MVRNPRLAKWITDIGGSTFRRGLEYFADKYGKLAIAVPPHNTSQNCSNCGDKVQKSLSTRTHICPHYGLGCNREWNAAINSLQQPLYIVGRRKIHAWGETPSGLVGEIRLASGGSWKRESLALRQGSVKNSFVTVV